MLVPMALAEDTNTNTDINPNMEVSVDSNITPNDEREARTMLSPYGAEVRMLQLEKSVTRNILLGNAVLQVITKNHADSNIIEAENILNSLEMLLEEVKTTPTDGDKNILVQTFVELKKEARTLSTDFKKQTQNLITSQDRKEIMTQVKEIDQNQLKNINNSIKEIVKTFNAEKIKEKFNSMGIKNEEMIGRIRNGDMNLKEIKEYALKEFKDMNVMEKKQIAAKMRNDSIKKIIEQREITQKMIKNLRETLMNNIQKRTENLNNWIERKAIDANANGDFNRAQRLTDQSERLQQIIERMEDRNGGRRQ